MLHAVADAAQACEHDRPAVVAATQEHDAHEGHHDSAPSNHAVSCDDVLQCCLAAASGVLGDVPIVDVAHRSPARIAMRVEVEPRSPVLPPDPPPPRA